MTPESFSVIDRSGRHVDSIVPSKELPLHFMLYERSEKVQAVIHTLTAFAACMDKSDGYLLKNHGPLVADQNLMSAFYCLEELEESDKKTIY